MRTRCVPLRLEALIRSPAALAAVALLTLAGIGIALGPNLAGGTDAVDADLDAAGEPAGPTEALGAVVGRVRDWDGRALAGVTVRIAGHDLVDETDAEGAFHFYAVPEGNVIVRAEADGYASNVRTLTVREGTVHQVNLRLTTPDSQPTRVTVHTLEGRVACDAVIHGAGVRCGDTWNHDLALEAPVADVVVEVAWTREDAERLNVTAGPVEGADPVTQRPAVTWTAAEGGPVLRLTLSPDERALRVSVRPAADETSVLRDVPYRVYVTVFHDRPAPEGYSMLRAP